jgi:hypothetical protein
VVPFVRPLIVNEPLVPPVLTHDPLFSEYSTEVMEEPPDAPSVALTLSEPSPAVIELSVGAAGGVV